MSHNIVRHLSHEGVQCECGRVFVNSEEHERHFHLMPMREALAQAEDNGGDSGDEDESQDEPGKAARALNADGSTSCTHQGALMPDRHATSPDAPASSLLLAADLLRSVADLLVVMEQDRKDEAERIDKRLDKIAWAAEQASRTASTALGSARGINY